MPAEIQDMAREESPEVPEWLRLMQVASHVSGRYREDGAAVREWYLGSESLLLYVTYVCDEDDAGLDDASVDELLGTLVVGDSQKARRSRRSPEPACYPLLRSSGASCVFNTGVNDVFSSDQESRDDESTGGRIASSRPV